MTLVTITAGITLCRETVLALAAAHIAQFSTRLELKGPGVRVADCEYYKALWIEIRTAMNLGRELGSEHVQELYDAISCGDYDLFLRPEELVAVNRKPARAS
jgi:hypothetical protein